MGIMLAVILGTVCGTMIAHWATCLFLNSTGLFGTKNLTRGARTLVLGSIAIASPPVWLSSFLIGGNFGGAFASSLAEMLNFPEKFFVEIGIFVGISLTLSSCIVVLRIVAGAVANWLLAKR